MANPLDIANAAAGIVQADPSRPKRPCPSCGVIQPGMDQPLSDEELAAAHAQAPAAPVSRRDNVKDIQKVFGGQ